MSSLVFNTSSVDLQASREVLTLLSAGSQLSVAIGKTSVEFDLTGSKQALQDRGACMDKNVKG